LLFRSQAIPGSPKGAEQGFVGMDKTDLYSTTAILALKWSSFYS
jgi:hypothetical protein